MLSRKMWHPVNGSSRKKVCRDPLKSPVSPCPRKYLESTKKKFDGGMTSNYSAITLLCTYCMSTRGSSSRNDFS